MDILIPTRKISEVKECLTSLLKMTTWKNRRIFAIINGKEDYEVVELKGSSCEELDPLTDHETGLIGPQLPYNWSRMNNRAMSITFSPYVIFLNDDTRIVSKDWIQNMLQFAQLEEVGAVGAMLLSPDGTIQHAGDYVTERGLAYHCFKGMGCNSLEVNGLVQSIHETSAVTSACMMVRRNVFEELGGFDEQLRNFDDFDFCLRLRERGTRLSTPLTQKPFTWKVPPGHRFSTGTCCAIFRKSIPRLEATHSTGMSTLLCTTNKRNVRERANSFLTLFFFVGRRKSLPFRSCVE